MRKPVLFLFLLFSIVAFSIVIKTNEKGVEVYLNNEHEYTIDGTSLILQREGMANIKLSLPGYWPVNYELKNVDLSSTKVIEVNFYPLTEATITGAPKESKIYIIDGSVEVFVGKAPYRGKLPLGRHVFKVVTPDGFSYTMERSVETSSTKIDLSKKYSRYVTIDTSPKSYVFVDNVYKGKSPVEVNLTYKVHTLEFYNKGFSVGKSKIIVSDDGIKIVDLYDNIKVKSVKVDYVGFYVRKILKVTLSSVPEGAFINIHDKLYRLPKTLELPEGTNTAYIEFPGYVSEKKEFNASKSSLVRLFLKPDQKKVKVDFNGKVYVNGEKKGIGPLSLMLLKGNYIMRFESGENKWLSFANVATNTTISVDKRSGTLVVGDIGVVKLNGNVILTPAILNLAPGNYEITTFSREGTPVSTTVTVERGKVTFYPEGYYFAVITSTPPGLDVKINGKIYTTPVFLYPSENSTLEMEFIYKYKCKTVKIKSELSKDNINYIRAAFRVNPYIGVEKSSECDISFESE